MRGVTLRALSVVLVSAVFLIQCSKKSTIENTLNLATTAKIKGLDPAHASDLYSGNEIARTYEGLYQFHYLKRPFVLEPNLADGNAEVSKDAKTYTIKLKKGVKFQDDPCFKQTGGIGRELEAKDVVYSWMRIADPKIVSDGWWIFDGKILGLNEWRDSQKSKPTINYDLPVAGLKVVDSHTVKITLTKPSHQFLYFLAMPYSYIVAREAVEHYGKDIVTNPVSTGPFLYDRKESNISSKLVWVRNPNYRPMTYPTEGEAGDQEKGLLADAGKRIPFADKIIVTIYVESQPMWLNFLKGNLDLSGIPKDNFNQAVGQGKQLSPELAAKGIFLLTSPALDVTHESFNMMDPVVGGKKNKLLRQAMSMAVNSGPLIELFYNGRALPAQGPIPPGLSGYDPEMKNPYREYNLEKAKELLAKAGYPGGKGLPTIEYQGTQNSTNRQMTDYFKKSMSELGITVNVNLYTWPEFLEKVRNRKGQMWGFAWGADYPDAENFLQLFYGKNVSPGSNDSNYVDASFDAMYDKALTLPEGPERTAIYKKMVNHLVEDAPWIWGVHRLNYFLSQKWIYNFKPTEFDHGISKYYRLDLNEKAEWLKKF